MIAVGVSEKWSDSECTLKERQQDLLMDWMQGREERQSGLLQGHLLKWGRLWEEQVGEEETMSWVLVKSRLKCLVDIYVEI